MEHKTIYPKNKLFPCINCPEILYDKDEYVTLGKGNIYSNIAFIVNNDCFSKENLIKIVEQLYYDTFKIDIYEKEYVTIFPKCRHKELIKKNTFVTIVERCINFLISELRRYCASCDIIILINSDFIEDKIKNVFSEQKIYKINNIEEYENNKKYFQDLLKQYIYN